MRSFKLTILILVGLSAFAAGTPIYVDDTALWAGGTLGLGRDATIYGQIGSAGSISTGRDASITGNIYSNSSIWIDRNSMITGDVRPGLYSSLSTGSNVTITGSTEAGLFDFDSFSHDWLGDLENITLGSDDIYVSRNQTETLSAGSYRDLSFDRNTILNLSAGEYSLRNFWMNRDGVVNVDTTAGDVTISITGSFSTGRNVKISGSGAGNVYINVYEHDVWLDDSSEIKATFNVYGGSFGVNKDVSLTGGFYATGDIWLGNNVELEHVPVVGVPEPATISFLSVALAAVVLQRKK